MTVTDLLESKRAIVTGGASDLASEITGQESCADGGITAWSGQPRFTGILGDITVP